MQKSFFSQHSRLGSIYEQIFSVLGTSCMDSSLDDISKKESVLIQDQVILFFKTNVFKDPFKNNFRQKAHKTVGLFLVALMANMTVLTAGSKASTMNALPLFHLSQLESVVDIPNYFLFYNKVKQRKKVVCHSVIEPDGISDLSSGSNSDTILNPLDEDYALHVEAGPHLINNFCYFLDLNATKISITTPSNKKQTSETNESLNTTTSIRIETRNFNNLNNSFEKMIFSENVDYLVLSGIEKRSQLITQLQTPNSMLSIELDKILQNKKYITSISAIFGEKSLSNLEMKEMILKFVKTLTVSSAGRLSTVGSIYSYKLQPVLSNLSKFVFSVFQDISKEKTEAWTENLNQKELGLILSQKPSDKKTKITPEAHHFCHFMPENFYKYFDLKKEQIFCILLPGEMNLSLDLVLYDSFLFFESAENQVTSEKHYILDTTNPDALLANYNNRLEEAKLTHFNRDIFKDAESFSTVQLQIIEKRLKYCSAYYFSSNVSLSYRDKTFNLHNRVCKITGLPQNSITIQQGYFIFKILKSFEYLFKEDLIKIVNKELSSLNLKKCQSLYKKLESFTNQNLKVEIDIIKSNTYLNDKMNKMVDSIYPILTDVNLAIHGASYFFYRKGLTSLELNNLQNLSFCKKLITTKNGQICVKCVVKEKQTISDYGTQVLKEWDLIFENIITKGLNDYIYLDNLENQPLEFSVNGNSSLLVSENDIEKVYEIRAIFLRVLMHKIKQKIKKIRSTQKDTLSQLMFVDSYLSQELVKTNGKLSFSRIKEIFNEKGLNFTFSEHFFVNSRLYETIFCENINNKNEFNPSSLGFLFPFIRSFVKQETKLFSNMIYYTERNTLSSDSFNTETKKFELMQESALLEKCAEITKDISSIKKTKSRRKKTTKKDKC